MTGIKRNSLNKLQVLLDKFPAVAIIGARQVGKTTLAQQLAPNWRYVDLEKPSDFQLISQDPNLYFQQFPSNIIIDEAQEYPDLFKVLRGVIDNNRERKGRFILTGSSSPDLLQQISESLAGRIAIVELGTLKANEYYQISLSPLYQLFNNKIHRDNLPVGKAPLSNEQVQLIWLKGGYPEPILSQVEITYQLWMEQYQDTYINRDIAKLFPRLNKTKYQRFIYMLGKLSGTIINKSDLGRALELNESTVRDYIKIADGTFVWRELLSYEKNSIKSVVKMPKGYIRDTGLLHYFLRVTEMEDLYRDPIVGRSFECFVIEELLKGLEVTLVTNWQSYYYRTRGGAEIDLILEGPFGLLPIEIKHGSSVRLKDLTTLSNFIEDHNLPLGIVFNQSDEIIWLTKQIVQIPVGWL